GWRSDRHGAVDRAARESALSEERAGALSGDLWSVDHPHHSLHARWHLGVRAAPCPALVRAATLRHGSGSADARAGAIDRGGRDAEGAGGREPEQAFRWPEGR